MDSFWSCFLILIFIASIGNAVSSDGRCDHQCIMDGKCNSTFIHNRCFYAFFDHLRSWNESRTHCQAQGLSMAKMDNELLQKNNHFSTLINDVPDYLKDRHAGNKAWLGRKAFNFPSWSFANGTTVHNWQLGLPDFNLAQQWTAKKGCGYFAPHGSNFSISIQLCHYNGYFLCRENDCDSDHIGDCLKLVMEQKFWYDARSHCIRLGGDLFYLKENEVLASVGLYRGSQIYSDISSITDNIHVHIGIIHREWKWNSPETDGEGWSDGRSILDTSWGRGSPSRYDYGCLVMHGDAGTWDDNPCQRPLLTLCQKEVEAPTTTEISPTSTNKQSDTKLGQGGSTQNLIIIILGSLLGLAVLIIAPGCFCWNSRRGFVKSSHIENNNNTSSSHRSPEEQSSTTDVYQYISDNEVLEKEAAPTVVYQYASSHDVPGLYMEPVKSQ